MATAKLTTQRIHPHTRAQTASKKMADIVKGEDVTFGVTYPSEVYPVVQKLANVIMSVLPRVADHLGRK